MKIALANLKVGDRFKIPSDSGIRILRVTTERTEDPDYDADYLVDKINFVPGRGATSVRISNSKGIWRIEKHHLGKEVNVFETGPQGHGPSGPIGTDGNVTEKTVAEVEEKPVHVKLSTLADNDVFKFTTGHPIAATDENEDLVYIEPDKESYVVLDNTDKHSVKICTIETYREWEDVVNEWESEEDFIQDEPEIENYYFVPGAHIVLPVKSSSSKSNSQPRLDESTAGSVQLGQSFDDFTLRCENSLKEAIANITSKAFDAALVEAIQREVEFVGAAPVEFRKNLHPSFYQSNDSFYINLFKGMTDVDDRRRGCIRDANALVLTYAQFRQIVNLVLTEKKKAGEKAEINLLPKREDEVENMELTALEHFMFIKMNNRGVDDAALAILWTLTPQEKPTLSIGL